MKKSNIIIELIIGMCVLFVGGYYGAKFIMEKNTSSNKVTNNKNSQQQNKSVVNNNDNNDLDLGILTEEEFLKAMSLGEKYKNKDLEIVNVNTIVWNSDEFRNGWGKGFIIFSPYVRMVDEAKRVAEQYLEVNRENIAKQIKTEEMKFDYFECIASVGGDTREFMKYTKIVLRVYGQNETKVLQPNEVRKYDYQAKMTDFFPDSPKYNDAIIGRFNAKEIIQLNPKQLEIIIIYTNGKEVKQIFDYNKLNQL